MTHQSWRYPKRNTDALLEFLERTTAEVDASDLYGHSWRNDEVLALLQNTRALLTTGQPVAYPGDDAELALEPNTPTTPDPETVNALAGSVDASRRAARLLFDELVRPTHAGEAVFDNFARVACSVCGWAPELPDLIAYNTGRPLGGDAWGVAGLQLLISTPHPNPKG